MVDEGFSGFNVTLPHKESMVRLCDEVDETARCIGAVNTVSIKHGRLCGTNTDAFGFIENVKEAWPSFSFLGKQVVLLGAGGAARAALYALIQTGVAQIMICNRSLKRAETLARDFSSLCAAGTQKTQLHVVKWEDRSSCLLSCDFLVNTTSLGMVGKERLEISLESLPSKAFVYDIVYTPLMTNLLTQAAARGCAVITGIGMLLHQARPAFAGWYGIFPEVDETLKQKVLA